MQEGIKRLAAKQRRSRRSAATSRSRAAPRAPTRAARPAAEAMAIARLMIRKGRTRLARVAEKVGLDKWRSGAT
jgi:hypothetical protein